MATANVNRARFAEVFYQVSVGTGFFEGVRQDGEAVGAQRTLRQFAFLVILLCDMILAAS